MMIQKTSEFLKIAGVFRVRGEAILVTLFFETNNNFGFSND